MKSLAAVVARSEAETLRRRLAAAGLLRRDLLTTEEEGIVRFPVTGRLDDAPAAVRWEEREFAAGRPHGPRSYADDVEVPPELRDRLPRAFDVVGDIVLVRIPPELRPHAPEIGAGLLRFVPGARLVGVDDGVEGSARLRQLVRIAGAGPWTTEQRENGLSIRVDLERAYFSPRLAREHALVAAEVRAGERVIDFACGVAPFGAHIVRDGRARELVAADMNPDATALAERNLAAAGPKERYRVVTAPIEEFAPHAGDCERAILNLPHAGFNYLPLVAATVARGGALHYYERTARSALERRPEELVNAVGSRPGNRWRLAETHTVHPYSPTEDIVAYRLERE